MNKQVVYTAVTIKCSRCPTRITLAVPEVLAPVVREALTTCLCETCTANSNDIRLRMVEKCPEVELPHYAAVKGRCTDLY